MLGSLVILTLAPAVPAAPVPKPPPPPVEVIVRRYVYPPHFVEVGGVQRQVNVDDGYFIEVTVMNTSTEPISVDTRHNFGDRVYVKITKEKGAEVSQSGYHLILLCSSRSKLVALKPGDSATVIAHLLQDWPHTAESRKPGKYNARVVFESGRIKAESAFHSNWKS